MEIILTIFVTVVVTRILLSEFLYSPKVQVERLWKKIFKNAHQIGELNKKDPGDHVHSALKSALESKNKKMGNLINAILENYIDDEEEDGKEFLKENRYEHSSINKQIKSLENVKEVSEKLLKDGVKLKI